MVFSVGISSCPGIQPVCGAMLVSACALHFLLLLLLLDSNPFGPVRPLLQGYVMQDRGDSGPGRNGCHPGNPYQTSQCHEGEPQCSTAHGLVRAPPASGGHRLSEAEVRLFPGERRPPGPDNGGRRGMRDDMWRRQTEASVAVHCASHSN